MQTYYDKQIKRFLSIWKKDEELRKQYNNDVDFYLEAMDLYLEECNEINQVS